MTGRHRVAIASLDFHREGGSEGRTGQLVDALVAAGNEVHLVGARIRWGWDPRTILHPIRLASHPHWLEVIQFSRRAAAFIRSGDFDVVHNQIRPFVPGVVTVGGGCHRYSVREVFPRERGWLRALRKQTGPLHLVLLRLEREGFRAVRCPFIIISCLSRDGILKHYPFPPERIVVVYSGVDSVRIPTECLEKCPSSESRAGYVSPRRIR
jgi:glycosyl transferase family 4